MSLPMSLPMCLHLRKGHSPLEAYKASDHLFCCNLGQATNPTHQALAMNRKSSHWKSLPMCLHFRKGQALLALGSHSPLDATNHLSHWNPGHATNPTHPHALAMNKTKGRGPISTILELSGTEL